MKHRVSVLISAMIMLALLCGCAQNGNAAEPVSEGNSMEEAVALLSDIPTTQYFTEEAVAEEDLQTILLAGVNAPSAMNGQPWHFTAITDTSVLQKISDDMSMGGPGFGGGTPPAGFTPPEGALPEGAVPEGVMPEGAVPGGTPEMSDKTAVPAPPAGAGGGGSVKAGIADAPVAVVISCAAGSELDAGLACQNMSATAQLLGYGSKIISSPTMALNGEKQAEYRELLGIPDNCSAAAILLIGYEDTAVDETVDGYTGATARNPLEDVVTYLK